MLHCGNRTCGDHPLTYSASHKDMAVGTKNLRFGFIRLKDTNKKKRLAWAKKHEQWILDWWKSVLGSESKFEIV